MQLRSALACILVLLDYCPKRVDAHTLNKINLPLVSKVQDYYKASSVVFVSGIEDIHTRFRMIQLIREFSKLYVASTILRYADLQHYYRSYSTRKVRPLIVVLLSTTSELENFQRITTRYQMSEALWLLLFINADLGVTCHWPLGNYFNLAFDTEMLVKCQEDAIVREWYAIGQNRTKTYKFANWVDSTQELVMASDKSLYGRRRNLNGLVLRLAIVKDSPFITVRDGQLNYETYFAKVLGELSRYLHFTPLVAYEELFFGSYQEASREWSGVIGRVTRGEVDIGLDEFTMTDKRLEAVDFSLPILRQNHEIFMRRLEKSNMHLWGHFRVYTSQVWMAIHGVYVLASVFITLMNFVLKDRPLTPGHFTESYFNVWGICWQQGLSNFPSAWPLRIAYYSILVKAVILYAVYSACLISYLAVSAPSVPFASLSDFADDNSYQLVTFHHGAHYELLTTSNDPLIKKITNKLAPSHLLPETLADGFHMPCNRKVAFYGTSLIQSQIHSYAPCGLVSLKTGAIDSIGITLTKRSPYTRIINFYLQKFREVGIMQRLISQTDIRPNPPRNEFNPVNVEEIAIVLSIFVTGNFVSVIVLMLERLIHRRCSSKGKQAEGDTTEKDSVGPFVPFAYVD